MINLFLRLLFFEFVFVLQTAIVETFVTLTFDTIATMLNYSVYSLPFL